MNVQSTACDPRRLERSLSDVLSDVEEEQLSSHLEQCPHCQEQLASLAAKAATWQRIQDVLRDESHSTVIPIVSDLSDTDYVPLVGSRDYFASPVDFAVDFLDPPTGEESLGRLGEIEILSVIGHGGMGIVLKGLQRSLNRAVAVKVLAPHLATSGAARQRFAREAQAAAVIMHANVMPIFSVDARAKLPYLVMPYIECESLQQRIDRTGPLDTVDTLRIGLQVARGLAAAHAQGLVHRDVKPANILLEQGVQRAMLTDFGLARAADDASLTRTGLIAGTPQYMSPEQSRGDAIDSRSDLFSLGSVLYTACAGRPPFRADTSYGILRKIIDTPARDLRELNPQTPVWLVLLIERLMAKSRTDRFDSAEHVADLLEQCLAHTQQPQALPLPEELKPAHRYLSWRSDRLMALAAGVLTLLLVALAVQFFPADEPVQPAAVPDAASLARAAALTFNEEAVVLSPPTSPVDHEPVVVRAEAESLVFEHSHDAVDVAAESDDSEFNVATKLEAMQQLDIELQQMQDRINELQQQQDRMFEEP